MVFTGVGACPWFGSPPSLPKKKAQRYFLTTEAMPQAQQSRLDGRSMAYGDTKQQDLPVAGSELNLLRAVLSANLCKSA